MQQHSYGFRITIQTGLDLTLATEVRIDVQKPSGAFIRRPLDMLTDIVNPATGSISYFVQKGDLDESGEYKIQIADVTAGRCLLSTVGAFGVVPSIHRPNTRKVPPHAH